MISLMIFGQKIEMQYMQKQVEANKKNGEITFHYIRENVDALKFYESTVVGHRTWLNWPYGHMVYQ